MFDLIKAFVGTAFLAFFIFSMLLLMIPVIGIIIGVLF